MKFANTSALILAMTLGLSACRSQKPEQQAAPVAAQGPAPMAANAPAGSREPVAVLDGTPIYESDLGPIVQPQLRQLRMQEYEFKLQAIEALTEKRILEAEAKKRGTTVEKLLEQKTNASVREPSDAEIEAFFLGQREKFNRPFAEVKPQLTASLRQLKQQKARADLVSSLRQRATIVVLLEPPKVNVAADPSRMRGNPNAPVMIVEFSDFECPFCRNVQPALKSTLAKYKDRVAISFRDFPLRQIHPRAEMAAEASRCAGDQGKFWEAHDVLFAGKLDKNSILEMARGLRLDERKFDSCMTAGRYKADIERDLREGTQAGVTGTPAFFINGIFLSGNQPASAFEQLIEAELSRIQYRAARSTTRSISSKQ